MRTARGPPAITSSCISSVTNMGRSGGTPVEGLPTPAATNGKRRCSNIASPERRTRKS